VIPLPCTVIEGIGVTKRYGRVPVLRGIDFAVKAGRVTAILGPNGAGKSTLIRMLLGLARPDEGSVTVAGTAVGDDPGYRAAIGYMPQHPHFPENLTGREVVRLLRELRRTASPRTTSCSRRSPCRLSSTSRCEICPGAPSRS